MSTLNKDLFMRREIRKGHTMIMSKQLSQMVLNWEHNNIIIIYEPIQNNNFY